MPRRARASALATPPMPPPTMRISGRVLALTGRDSTSQRRLAADGPRYNIRHELRAQLRFLRLEGLDLHQPVRLPGRADERRPRRADSGGAGGGARRPPRAGP